MQGLTINSQDMKAKSPNWLPYISLLVIPENLVLYQDNLS